MSGKLGQTWGTPLPAYQANREMNLTPALRGDRAFPGKMMIPRLLRIGGFEIRYSVWLFAEL